MVSRFRRGRGSALLPSVSDSDTRGRAGDTCGGGDDIPGADVRSVKRPDGVLAGALISAALFGLYHGNLLQGVYAFLLGLVMAWLYERFQTLAAPWVFHAAANVTSIVIVNTGLGILAEKRSAFAFYTALALAVVLSVFCLIRIERKTNIKEEEV